MKSPEIKLQHDVMKELGKAPYNLSESAVEKMVKDGVKRGEEMAGIALKRINKAVNKDTVEAMQKAWKDDKDLKAFFGTDKLTKENMRDVQNRMERCCERLSEKQLTIRVWPQSKAPDENTNAQNGGMVFSPKTFKIFARWFGKTNEDQRAAIFIHELHHDLFLDQKIKNEKGERVTVYGTKLAKQLAKEDPGKARKSAENYEQFCLAVSKVTETTEPLTKDDVVRVSYR